MILAQRVNQGVLAITVTETEITLRMPDVPETGVYRGGAEAEITLGRQRTA